MEKVENCRLDKRVRWTKVIEPSGRFCEKTRRAGIAGVTIGKGRAGEGGQRHHVASYTETMCLCQSILSDYVVEKSLQHERSDMGGNVNEELRSAVHATKSLSSLHRLKAFKEQRSISLR